MKNVSIFYYGLAVTDDEKQHTHHLQDHATHHTRPTAQGKRKAAKLETAVFEVQHAD